MKTYSDEGIVLKRRNFGEADRLVTVYTKENGKITALAKGVRRLTSRKKGALEVGCRARFLFVKGRSLDLITQASIISSFSPGSNLHSMTLMYQILEIIDSVTAEKEEKSAVYQLLSLYIDGINHNLPKIDLLKIIGQVLAVLGFAPPGQLSELSLKHLIEDIAQRRLKTKEYLTPKD